MPLIIDVKDECAAGHAKITGTLNGKAKVVIAMKQDLAAQITDEEIEVGLPFLVKVLGRAAGLTTWNQVKTYFNNREVVP